MIPFLDLKGLNAQYRVELIEACTKVIDSGWYVQGNECKEFDIEFANYCGSKYAIGVANGLDALILILRAYKELGFMKDGDELHLKADKGRIDRGAKTDYIEGNVEGYGRDGEELYAENLTYDGNKDILSTDKAFVVKKDGKVLTADEFDADRVLQKITARGHAKLAEEEGAK